MNHTRRSRAGSAKTQRSGPGCGLPARPAALLVHFTAFPPRRLQAGVGAGLIAGIVFLVLEMFMVWAFMSESPWAPVRMMGAIVLGENVLPPPATFALGVTIAAMIVHFVFSIVYGVIGGAIVNRFQYGAATLIGAIHGWVLYMINFHLIAPVMFPWFVMARGWINIFAHIVFGAVIGAAYLWLRDRRRYS